VSQTITLTLDGAARSVRVSDGVESYAVALGNLPALAEQLATKLTGAKTLGKLEWCDALNSHGIAWTGTQATRLRMVVGWKQEERKSIFYRGMREAGPMTEELAITIPPRLWVLSWQGGALQESRLYVCKEEFPMAVVDDTTQIEPYPGGNVYEHGGICWGSTPLPTFSIGAQAAVDHLFFTSLFNGDVARLPYPLKEWYTREMRRLKAAGYAAPAPRLPWSGAYPTTLMRALRDRG